MSQIKQILRLYQTGWKIKGIARHLGVSKNTVRTYLKKLETANWPIDAVLSLEDPLLEAKFHAGNPAYKDLRYECKIRSN